MVSDRTTGARSIVRLRFDLGGDFLSAADVTVLYGPAGWQVDDVDADYLRSMVGTQFAYAAQTGGNAEIAEIDNCLSRSLGRRNDASAKRAGYEILGRQHRGLVVAYDALARCRDRGISTLRRVFESQMRDEMEGDSDALPPDVIDCTLRGARSAIPDTAIADVLENGGIDGHSAERLLFPALLRVVRTCGAPGALSLSAS